MQKNNLINERGAYIKKKEERRKVAVKNLGSKKPVYQHHRILAPDGLQLCNCDEKKINWYLSKGLADLI